MAELKLGYIQPVGADKVVVEGKFIKGGYLVVATTADMAALLTEGQDVIVNGSLCYCQADSKFYQYNGTAWVEKLSPELPTPINDKYLHANASTGALEWVDAGIPEVQTLPTPTETSPKVIFNLADNSLYILQDGGGESKYSPITDIGQADYAVLYI